MRFHPELQDWPTHSTWLLAPPRTPSKKHIGRRCSEVIAASLAESALLHEQLPGPLICEAMQSLVLVHHYATMFKYVFCFFNVFLGLESNVPTRQMRTPLCIFYILYQNGKTLSCCPGKHLHREETLRPRSTWDWLWPNSTSLAQSFRTVLTFTNFPLISHPKPAYHLKRLAKHSRH